MMKFLRSKKGVTLLEGLIALLLLSVVATGTFAVLLSTSRKSGSPNIREEMALAVENAHKRLQQMVAANYTREGLTLALCPNNDANSANWDDEEVHSIPCMLPAICDPNESSFTYQYEEQSPVAYLESDDRAKDIKTYDTLAKIVHFNITCNGFTL